MQSVNSSILEKERGLVVVTQASLFFYFFFLLPIVSFFPVALDYLETILPKIPDLFSLLPTICLTKLHINWTIQGIYAILYV